MSCNLDLVTVYAVTVVSHVPIHQPHEPHWPVRKLPENFHPQKKCENLKSRAITKPIRRGIIPNCGTGRERNHVAHRLRSLRKPRGLCPLQGGAPTGCGRLEVEGDSGRRQRSRQVRQDGPAGQLQPFQVFLTRIRDASGRAIADILSRGHVEALENINLVTEGIVSDYLKSVLELNLPQTSGKKSKVVLGVSEKNLAGAIKGLFPGLECETADTSDIVGDVIRGIRLHADKLLGGLKYGDVEKAGLGMGHAYSRAKVKFSVTRNDNHIIQASATIDFQDKGVNQFYMRVREWYGWHFPELVKIVSDNYTYCKLVLAIGDKKSLNDDKLHDIAALVEEDGEKAQAIIDAAKVSMGLDISEADLEIVNGFAQAVVKQADNRKSTNLYLEKKMSDIAPNLQTLIGTPVAARLISHAGSLTNLSKYPASTLQILGAEKALFRALKTKSNTPKYGLIYHSSFIGKAGVRNKGRISRYLANKCSMASRIDNFSEEPSTRFGEALKQQVEDRLEFYATGKKPAKNAEVMVR